MWADLGGDRVNELRSDDFEVLHWVIERFQRHGHSIEVGEALRVFPEEQYDSVRESLRRLSTHTYLVTVNGGGIGRSARTEPPVVKDVTERAVNEPDPEKRFKLKAGLEGVGGMTRDVLVDVVRAAIARSTGAAWPWTHPRDTIAQNRP